MDIAMLTLLSLRFTTQIRMARTVCLVLLALALVKARSPGPQVNDVSSVLITKCWNGLLRYCLMQGISSVVRCVLARLPISELFGDVLRDNN